MTLASFVEHEFQYPENGYIVFMVVLSTYPHTSGLVALGLTGLFYVIEF